MRKFTKEIIEAVQEVSKKSHAVNDVVITGGYNNDLFDAASSLYSAVGNLMQALEENDENMDPARTKLPNLDEVFGNDPVTEYVSSIINLATGEGKPEAVLKAAKKLEAHQNGIQHTVTRIYPNTLEGFVQRISDKLDLVDEEATTFQSQLKNAVIMLKSRPGAHCEFVNGKCRGNVNIKGSVITIKIDGTSYTYDESVKEKEKKYDGFCCEYPTEPVADDEELFNQLHKHKSNPTLADYVTKYGFGEYDPNELLDTIQTILDRRIDILSNDDYKLIRFYLKQKPYNNPEVIDILSKRALELAWRRFMYTRKSMK